MTHETGPFSIPAIRFVPQKLKPWLVVFMVVIFQLSGGVYMAAVSEMTGSLALLQEDVMMAGYASLIGLSLVFCVMFRLKFAVISKTTLLLCCFMIILGNLVCMNTYSVPVLILACFVTGFFRMWATFECNSTIQLWITPKRDLSVFFCFIELLVNGAMQTTGLMAIYTSYLSIWEYMHWVIIALLCIVALVVIVFYKPQRFMPRIPFFGIDWLGALLWTITVMSTVFVLNYGEHYDWFHSDYIIIASSFAIASLVLNLWRASFIRHPFIENRTWQFPMVYLTIIVYMAFYVLVSPSHLIEHIYMGSILGFDSLNVISLNWIVLLATFCGAFFTWRVFAVRKASYRDMIIISFGLLTMYLLILYFTLDFNQTKESLYLPVFLRSFAYVIMGICFLTALARIPFDVFFQGLTCQAFFSTCVAATLGGALLQRAMTVLLKKNVMLLGATMDSVNPLASSLSFPELYGVVQRQALMVTFKELYGWLAVLGVFSTIVLLAIRSDIRPKAVYHPTYKAIRRLILRENK